jgi:hypothetical protein
MDVFVETINQNFKKIVHWAEYTPQYERCKNRKGNPFEIP